MASQPNTRAHLGQRREGERAALPAGTIDQSLLWKDVRQAVLFVAFFTALGGGVIWFLLLDRPAQAMIAYSALVVWCLGMILAGLRRGARR